MSDSYTVETKKEYRQMLKLVRSKLEEMYDILSDLIDETTDEEKIETLTEEQDTIYEALDTLSNLESKV